MEKLNCVFFLSEQDRQPVREWLKELTDVDRRAVGSSIREVQLGWPIGMPLVKKLENGIWEVRVNLENTIARVLVNIDGSEMVLLHGFIKKTPKTPLNELAVARERLKISTKRKR